MREPYKEWAEGHINRVKNILNSARAEHTQAVKDRIAGVEQMKDVVAITEGLFALSKETAQLESEIFVQRQKVALASEVKAVLDSWVRYEQQQKESEQADLAKTVIENVLKSIRDEKTQRDILAGAVAEVERMSPTACSLPPLLMVSCRAGEEQGHLKLHNSTVSTSLELYIGVDMLVWTNALECFPKTLAPRSVCLTTPERSTSNSYPLW